jgi:starch-binding outer membrane protein, SusD/RagB family
MKKQIIFLVAVIIAGMSCKKSFLDRPATDSVTLDNYYNNATEVNGAVGVLYNSVWIDWFDKAFVDVGDVMAGTLFTRDDNYKTFYNFNVQSTDGLVGATWKSCYKAAGNASVLIQTFQQKKGKVSNPAYLDLGIAEAKFIRAFAYFYIGRAFGDAPIVDDPVAITEPGKYLVPRYLQKDVLRFAIEDLKAAEQVLPETPYQPGRVTRYSAKGLMAKIYLYLKDYANAKAKAKEVIDYATANPDKIGLYPDYGYMFTTSKANNNKESLFALQWDASRSWNGGNAYQNYLAPYPLIGVAPTSAGGYSACVPSIDMLDPATGYAPGDLRKGWSVMQQGFHRADWKNNSFPNGFTYDTTGQQTTATTIYTPTRSNVLKYVVGPAGRSDEPVNAVHTSICTYLLRYADVLLIYAEAALLGGGIDGTALSAYNAVHQRAGFTAVGSFTIDDILRERKCEFAFEGDYWFDIQRQGFEKAKQMVATQERGFYNSDGSINSFKVTLNSASQLFLPIPQAETVLDPKLLEPAVPYY